MTYRCCWCHADIMDFQHATTFLSKTIHLKCMIKLRREFKKEYEFVIPMKEKEKNA